MARAADGHPAVAVFCDPVEGPLGVGAEPHRGAACLSRFWPAPDGVEVDELTVEFGLVLGPDLSHGKNLLPDDLPAVLVVGAVVFHLFPVPAGADSEDEAAIGDDVNRRTFLRQGDGITLDDQANPGAQFYTFSHRGCGCQRNKRVVAAPIPFRQVATGREGCFSRHRDVGVLGKEQRIQATLLNCFGQFYWSDGLVGWKNLYPECRHVPCSRGGNRPHGTCLPGFGQLPCKAVVLEGTI